MLPHTHSDHVEVSKLGKASDGFLGATLLTLVLVLFVDNPRPGAVVALLFLGLSGILGLYDQYLKERGR